MIKHIIALVATLLVAGAFWYMAKLDSEANRFQNIAKLIKKTEMEKVKVSNNIQPIQHQETHQEIVEAKKKEDDETAKKLKALKDRAGNLMAFKVSPLYKTKCSSCHGVNGEGIIGPRLVGKSEAQIYKALTDFKSGKRKNYVMYGLLSKMNDDQLKSLSKEISTFADKLKASSN